MAFPRTYYDDFKQLAFEQFQKHNVVFYSQDVSKELVHFGFLDSVLSLYCGGGVSYNFLHLTVQEFLVAYHITQLSSGIDVFNHHSEDRRWEVVWRFVSGWTGFKYFKFSVLDPAFCSRKEDTLMVTNLFIHCLFESRHPFDFVWMNRVYSSQENTSPLDRYALGYCIANCSSTTSWAVKMGGGSGESFVWGLNSNHSGKGTISQLTFSSRYTSSRFEFQATQFTRLDSYPVKILHGIRHLELCFLSFDKVLPPMNNLTSLALSQLGQRCNDDTTSNLSSLSLYGFLCDNDTMFTSFYNLIHSPKLKHLAIGKEIIHTQLITKPLSDVFFGTSTLNELTLINCEFEENALDLLETNTCLTKVTLSACYIMGPPFQTISRILQNKTIQKLQIDSTSFMKNLDLEQVEIFKAALSSNTSLEQLKLVIDFEYHCSMPYDWSLLTDPRVYIVNTHIIV